jgi:hypothetical protein
MHDKDRDKIIAAKQNCQNCEKYFLYKPQRVTPLLTNNAPMVGS